MLRAFLVALRNEDIFGNCAQTAYVDFTSPGRRRKCLASRGLRRDPASPPRT